MSFQLNIPSPIHSISLRLESSEEFELDVKRDDLIHPIISGNKWRKLKLNLEKALNTGHDTVLTFGGAYSNHIAATAYATTILGIKSIGIIRGEEVSNATLDQAREHGMHLIFVDRTTYRNKTNQEFLEELKQRFGSFYLIPEGGANDLGVKGCETIIEEISDFSYDYVCVPAGTGTTAAGIIRKLQNCTCLVFSALKGGYFLEQEIEQHLPSKHAPYHLIEEYHFGGFGKCDTMLLDFMQKIYSETGLQLDQVYTAKMLFGLVDMIQKKRIKPNSKILLIHTGGLQGNTKIKFH